MVTEDELMERIIAILSTIDEDTFLEVCNAYLGTTYIYADVVWRDDINE